MAATNIILGYGETLTQPFTLKRGSGLKSTRITSRSSENTWASNLICYCTPIMHSRRRSSLAASPLPGSRYILPSSLKHIIPITCSRQAAYVAWEVAQLA